MLVQFFIKPCIVSNDNLIGWNWILWTFNKKCCSFYIFLLKSKINFEATNWYLYCSDRKFMSFWLWSFKLESLFDFFCWHLLIFLQKRVRFALKFKNLQSLSSKYSEFINHDQNFIFILRKTIYSKVKKIWMVISQAYLKDL